MNSSRKESTLSPLLHHLAKILRQLENEHSGQLIAATPNFAVLRERHLPGHIRAIPQKRHGPRRAVRGRRHYTELKSHVALWPNDGLVESFVPSLGYVITGAVDFQIADYVISCKTGDCVIFPAGVPKTDGSQPHFRESCADRLGEVLWISPGISQNHGLSCWVCRSEGDAHTKPLGTQCRVEHRFLAQLFDGLCEETSKTNRPKITYHLLSAMLRLLRDEIHTGRALLDWGRPRYQNDAGKTTPIGDAFAFIEEHLDEHLTIEKVAREVFLSPSTFTRLFRQETGQTFQEYQTAQRMAVAEKMLMSAEFPIVNICRRVGLKYDRLRQLFQEKHGCSPSKFRERKN